MATESVTVADTAIGLTAATYANARGAFLTLETAQIRFYYDGTTPTNLLGHLLEVGQTLNLYNEDEIRNFRGIRTGGTSGVLRVTYEGK